jgi:hypothetical protein
MYIYTYIYTHTHTLHTLTHTHARTHAHIYIYIYIDPEGPVLNSFNSICHITTLEPGTLGCAAGAQYHVHTCTHTDRQTNSHTCIQVLNLKPGTVGCIEEAMYGDRTSFLDVTAVLAAAVDGTNARTHAHTHTRSGEK